MASLMAHLNEPWKGDLPLRLWGERPAWLTENPTRLQVFAALVGLNGGRMRVGGWGCMTGGGPYGRVGLEQNEALALIQLGAFVEGWLQATSDAELPALTAALNAEHDRIAALSPPPAAGEGNAG